jgi:hypothetical protein
MSHTGFGGEILKEKDRLENQGVGARIILKRLNSLGGHGMDTCGSGQGQLAVSYEHGNETYASINYKELSGSLRAY